ncbi:MAG TPA: glycosyltransferase family 4 protein [Cryptosporangiaceae bacterium]|nr:glycosyltransferase family 4 protein [Cryptosporangiaceae bacterium]
MAGTLVVTNDFPPRPGGIQAFVHQLAIRQPAGSLTVYAPAWPRSAAFDAEQPFEVVRHPGSLMLPTGAVSRRAMAIVRDGGCDTVWFGATAPLGLLAPALRNAGATRFVAQSHGHEVGWATTPGARGVLRRIARELDVVTYLGPYTRGQLAPVVGGFTDLVALPPGVDTAAFHPGVDGSAVRAEFGLSDRPVVVCVSRLVPRKGQDQLIRALPRIRAQVPGAVLLLVSDGPDQGRLRRLAVRTQVAEHVVFTGSVRWRDLPHYYAAGDVFAMPCRTRRRGWDVEGLGIVYLEASATGLPVVAGDSGGAPDAVLHGQTGYVVPGRDVDAITDHIVRLLRDRELAARLGAAGRAWVERAWRWDDSAARMTALLAGRRTPDPDDRMARVD